MSKPLASNQDIKIAELRAHYRQKLAGYVAELKEHWSLIHKNPQHLDQLLSIVHRLSGSGKSYGFPDISALAKQCELASQNSLSSYDSDFRSELEGPLENLLAAIAREADFETLNHNSEDNTDTIAVEKDASITILLLDDDTDFAAQLCAKLSATGFQVYHRKNIEQLSQYINTFRPDMLIVDMDFYGDRLAGANYVSLWRLTDSTPLPIFFVSAFDSFEVRLAAARAGASHFMRKPLDINKLITLIQIELSLENSTPYRVLIVDDDEDLLLLYSTALSGAGYEVWTATHAEQALLTLEQAQPELILIDVYMPYCDGIELGKIIRQHEEFTAIPLLFMSAAADTDVKLACARLANDEFITKPIETWRLLMVVKSRVAKGRSLKSSTGNCIVGEIVNDRDLLTGLHKVTKIRNEISRMQSQTGSIPKLALLRLDIRDFHTVNNLHGYFLGDEILQRLAWEFTRCLKNGDILCRESADQFILLRTQYSDLISVDKLITSLKQAIETVNKIESHIGLTLTVDIGVALSDENKVSATRLLDASDAALFTAKRSPVADVCYFGEAILENLKVNAVKVDAIKRALENGMFVAAYQPIVDIKNGHIVGMEALARWREEDNKLLGPAEFIPLLEEQGLISKLTIQMMRQVIPQLMAWRNRFSNLFMSFNLSAQDIQTPIFINELKHLLDKHQVNPRYLVLEITESELLSDWQQASKVLRSLKEIGVQIAIDDFGTGYSSLSYLQRINADKLKIDRSFIQHWTHTKDSRLLSLMMQLGKTMGMTVIAEGIETQHELAFLKTLECDQYQGYFKAMPMLAEVIEQQTWFVD